MSTEKQNKEIEKYNVQQELIKILENTQEESLKFIPRLSVEATIPLDVEKGNHLYNMVEILAPKMREAKILDLFCGENSIKQYFKEHNFPGQVIGVDIEDEKADIKADVAKIEESIEPKAQFDIVVSSGAVPGVENYETTAKYLNNDGLYIVGGSRDYLDDEVLNMIEKTADSPQEDCPEKISQIQKVFRPVAILETQHIPNKFGYDLNDVYIIWRKRSNKPE